MAKSAKVPVAPEPAELLPGSWRRWQQAFEAYDSGDEAETFQSVGVRLRECFVSFVGETRDDELVPAGQTPPKAADFKGWTELLANHLASYYPLHAAGYPGGPNALDLVVSSCTPTVRTLGKARPWHPRRASKPLIVALPQTPGLPDLPAVEQELAHVAAVFPDCRVLRGPAATRDRITTALPDHDIAHFACHGGHDSHRHYEGHLVVLDGPLPASAIVGVKRADLAFLSACGTARHRVDLPDESLSVATSFQLAGFSHVVASLWPIAHQTTMRVVADFYAALSGGDDPAHALHAAVRAVRARYPDQPSLWAPYTHRGI